jgi:hypothetical protein
VEKLVSVFDPNNDAHLPRLRLKAPAMVAKREDRPIGRKGEFATQSGRRFLVCRNSRKGREDVSECICMTFTASAAL